MKETIHEEIFSCFKIVKSKKLTNKFKDELKYYFLPKVRDMGNMYKFSTSLRQSKIKSCVFYLCFIIARNMSKKGL